MRYIVLIPFGVVIWCLQIAIKLPTVLLGYVVVPFLWRYRYTDIDMVPVWLIPWANPEDWHGGFLNYDGSLPKWWVDESIEPLTIFGKTIRKGREHRGRGFWSFYRYHARRNPADGLRNIKALQLWIDRERVWYWTPTYFKHYEPWYDRTPGVRGYIAGQGAFIGIKVQWVREKSYSETKLGFRVEPLDAHRDLPDTSARKFLGASFASKLIIHRELE